MVYGHTSTTDLPRFMRVSPAITMAGMFLFLDIFARYLDMYQPKAHQPATYGDIQRLSRLIDELDHKPLFGGTRVRPIEESYTTNRV